MQLSIIIPCYNMERYLPECIDSLLDQNLNPSEYEVIIINDESKDSTLKVANNYAAKHSNIIVIDKKTLVLVPLEILVMISLKENTFTF